jgi:hypothetical protein
MSLSPPKQGDKAGGDPAQAADFLRRRFPGVPETLSCLIWTARGKRSNWLPVGQLAGAEAFLAPFCMAEAGNVYAGVALSLQDYGPKHRCESEQDAGIAGLWADLDVKGPTHKQVNLPETIEQARELARSLGVEPTEEIDSGYGLQGYWLFEQPWVFKDDADRQKAADLARRLQDLLQEKAKGCGWKIDSTHDLARILRLPGTYNCKGDYPVLVRVLQTGGPRYQVGDLLALVTPQGHKPWTAKTSNGTSLIERARKYVAKMPTAISGQRGHDATWAVTQALVRGFDLSVAESRPLLEEYNRRCEPPWSEKELEHKLGQAHEKSRLSRGYLLNADGRRPHPHDRNGRPEHDAQDEAHDDAEADDSGEGAGTDDGVTDALLGKAQADPDAAIGAALGEEHLPALIELREHDPAGLEAFLRKLRKADCKRGDVDNLRRTITQAWRAWKQEQKKQKASEQVERRQQARACADSRFWNYRVEETATDDGKVVQTRVGLPLQALAGQAHMITKGWPRRVGPLLFAEVEGPRPLWLERPPQLMAWLSSHLPGGDDKRVRWGDADDMVSEARFHAYLAQTVREYAAVETFPHHPLIDGHYYCHPPASGGDGKALHFLLQRFRPSTFADADLILSLFLTGVWGGGPGQRPAFPVEAEDGDERRGRGTGKSTLIKMVAYLLGGYVEASAKEDIDTLKPRFPRWLGRFGMAFAPFPRNAQRFRRLPAEMTEETNG